MRLLDLHSLTDQLDDRITEHLIAAGTPTNFTEAQYEKAYKELDNYDERMSQIRMILDSLRFTHHVSQMTFIGVVLKSAKVAAGMFTKDRTIGMLEHAYSTLRGIKNIEYLVDQVQTREVSRLDRIYGLD